MTKNLTWSECPGWYRNIPASLQGHKDIYAGVAQQVEQLICNHQVGSSILSSSTISLSL